MQSTAEISPPARASMMTKKLGEFQFLPSHFERVAKLLHDATGIKLPESKQSLVYSRLSRRLRVLKIESFDKYCEFVASPAGQSEFSEMCQSLTTNVTKFFREEHHFVHMREKALRPIIEAARSGQRIRMWSAACSSGEEAYSMALTLLAMMPDATSFDIKILATDLSAEVVEKGKQGCYGESDVETIPKNLLSRWFSKDTNAPQNKQYQIADEIKKLISFRQLNLIDKWPMNGPFQIIFCRNVAIYFDENTNAHLWQKLAQITAPGGFLYIGHSERIRQHATLGLTVDGITLYEKHGGVI
ncbi:MAG: protein-glutamate O-methyltransferase [Hyphomicrobiaceae bacterium]